MSSFSARRLASPLFLLLAACGAAPKEEPPTWSGEVMPIVHARCASCHSAGGAAPFALDTYAAMAPYASAALAAMEAGTMPPWPADPDCRHYEGERLLADGELDTFRAWVEGGTPEGDPALATAYTPPASSFVPTDTIALDGTYTSSATTGDDYRCFVLDALTFDTERYLHGTQVIPAIPQVHHVLVFALDPDLRPEIEAADAADEGPGYTCFGGPYPSTDRGETGLESLRGGAPNRLASWVPGAQPQIFPDDVSVRIDPGSVAVMQIHYSATGGDPAPDTTELQLELGTEPTPYLYRALPLAIPDMEIPAGESDVVVTRTFPLYGDAITVTSVAPHMHLLAEQARMWAIAPDGTETCLVDIPAWDFAWQQTYWLGDDTVTVEDGGALALTCHFDNSAENQPTIDGVQQAPRDVSWGEGTLDEMCLSYYGSVVPYEPVEDASAPACDGVSACLDACGDTPTLECLWSCPESDFECFSCTLAAGRECGLNTCAATLIDLKDCLQVCGSAGYMLESNVGDCMAGECPDEYAAFLACAEPVVADDACVDAFDTCGAG